jgi:methylamine---glutamate N-methyltransferase subunit A
MCGIFGFLSKRSFAAGPSAGRTALTMLEALACRGPDSVGAAVIGPTREEAEGIWSVRVARAPDAALDRLGTLGEVYRAGTDGTGLGRDGTVRFDFRPAPGVTADDVERALGARRGGPEVLSLGRRLDLVKRVGAPGGLEAAYALSRWTGPLVIGHTRMSTESRIDLSHSQPFWAHGVPDLAIVHNRHITNYHVLRRRYEQRGVRFYTENDSEIVGVYVGERLAEGEPLEVALRASLRDLDGSYSYLAATEDALGFAKDPFALKPLLVAETEQFVAVANEEIAIRAAFPGTYEAREAQAKEVRVWQRSPRPPRSPATAEQRATSTPRSSERSRGARPAFA